MRRVLTQDQVDEIRDRLLTEPVKAIAADYGVDYNTIWYIKTGKTWNKRTQARPGTKWRHVSLEEAQEIRDEWATGEYTRLDLMYKHKVSDRTLRNILTGREKFAALDEES